jgi:3-hydroxyisobutyrate dehydrogenase-like beta-hydroxyacid dehydrogenase
VVGFVGLGQQGGPMAANLIAAGYDLIVPLAQLDDQRADLSRSLEGWESRGGVTLPRPRQ